MPHRCGSGRGLAQAPCSPARSIQSKKCLHSITVRGISQGCCVEQSHAVALPSFRAPSAIPLRLPPRTAERSACITDASREPVPAYLFQFNCRHLPGKLLGKLRFQNLQCLKARLTLALRMFKMFPLQLCPHLCRLSLQLVDLLPDGGDAGVAESLPQLGGASQHMRTAASMCSAVCTWLPQDYKGLRLKQQKVRSLLKACLLISVS